MGKVYNGTENPVERAAARARRIAQSACKFTSSERVEVVNKTAKQLSDERPGLVAWAELRTMQAPGERWELVGRMACSCRWDEAEQTEKWFATR